MIEIYRLAQWTLESTCLKLFFGTDSFPKIEFIMLPVGLGPGVWLCSYPCFQRVMVKQIPNTHYTLCLVTHITYKYITVFLRLCYFCVLRERERKMFVTVCALYTWRCFLLRKESYPVIPVWLPYPDFILLYQWAKGQTFILHHLVLFAKCITIS